jgi:RTX calcium-binding nonapeptide repeat (4 copies)
MRLTRTHLLCGLAVALTASVAPGSASADPRGRAALEVDDFWQAQLRYAGEFAGFRIAAAAGAGPNDQLSIGYQATPSPDVVFVSPGGIAPPPAPCIAASLTTVRCPAAGLTVLDVGMGPGRDRVDTVRYDSPSLAGFTAMIQTGPGRDRWVGGPLGESWFGGPGGDFARGGAGNDRFIGGPGNESMFGGPGIDFFKGGAGADFARGGSGNDRGFGGPGNDNFRD